MLWRAASIILRADDAFWTTDLGSVHLNVIGDMLCPGLRSNITVTPSIEFE